MTRKFGPLRRKRSAEDLADYVTAYCRQHFEQICGAAFANEMARRAGEASRGQRTGRLIPKGVAAVPPIYGFFIAVTAGQVLELYDGLAERTKGMSPLGAAQVGPAAARIVAETMRIDEVEAAATVDDAMELAPNIAEVIDAVRGATDKQFQANLNHLDKAYARAILLYCAAEKTADLVFDAWQRDPRHPPEPDKDTAADFARLVGARVLEPGEELEEEPLPAAGGAYARPAPQDRPAPRKAAPAGPPASWPNLNLAS